MERTRQKTLRAIMLGITLCLLSSGASAPAATTGTGLLGQYSDANGTKVTRLDSTVNFDWGEGRPMPQLSADSFSVQWNGLIEPQFSETYTFYTLSDDGVRLWIDGVMVIDNYTDHAPTEDSYTTTLEAGRKYSVRLDYFEDGIGAVMKLMWSSPSTPKAVIPETALYPAAQGSGAGLSAEYFDGVALSGTAVHRLDPTVDFSTSGSPVAGVNEDNFSARWMGWVQPRFTGAYTFHTDSDDGVRLWVNNKQIINNWTDHPETTDSSAPINLVAGKLYSVRMEFYENGGNAVARLKWSHANEALSVIPMSQLYPAQNGHDLAVTKITVPKLITLRGGAPVTKLVSVTIQNRSSHNEIIADAGQLNSLVSLEIRPLGDNGCHIGGVTLLTRAPQRTLPMTLKPGQRVNVYYNVLFDCAVDSGRGAGREDYSYFARVHHTVINADPDLHPDCDICPRGPTSGDVDPYPAGKTKDKGCGASMGNGTFGNPVLTDVYIKP